MAYRVGRCLLRERLKDIGMTQTELADRLGVTKQQIQNYIKPVNPRIMSYQTAYNVARILHCRMEELYEMIEVGESE